MLAFSDVCYYIEISHGITYHINKSSQHWRGKNYCHALYSALDSVKMGDCVDCCSVAKALCCRHPQNSVLLSLSNSRYRVRRCFLGADTPIAAPSSLLLVCGMYRDVTSFLFKLITLPIVHLLSPAPGFYLSGSKLTW